MARWSKTVDIKTDLHNPDRSDRENGLIVVAILRRHPEFAEAEAGWVLDDMEEAAEEEDLDLFNSRLNDVYDIADRERIWLGL